MKTRRINVIMKKQWIVGLTGLLACAGVWADGLVVAGWETLAMDATVVASDVAGTASWGVHDGDASWFAGGSRQCIDGAFGTLGKGATTNQGVAVIQLDGGSSPTFNAYLEFLVTNHGTEVLRLSNFCFDAWLAYGNQFQEYALSLVGGDLGTTNRFYTGALSSQGAVPAEDGADYEDFDIPLSVLSSSVLAPGETATFRLDFIQTGSTAAGWFWVDNIAIVAESPALQELDATVHGTGEALSLSALPLSAGGPGAFPISVGGGQSFLLDLAGARCVDYVQLRKHFWDEGVPADLEVAVYTGAVQTASEVASSSAWKTVATLSGDPSNSEKIFSFPAETASFLKITLLRAWDDSVQTYVGEVLVGCGTSPLVADADGDGVADWDEFMAGTDPTDANSRFLVSLWANSDFPECSFDTVVGRRYALYSKTNLSDAVWLQVGGWIDGTGEPVSISESNTAEQIFYRVELIWP